MGLLNWLFSRACRIVFNRVDNNKDGRLQDLEVEIAVLYLCNFLNKRLPGWQDPPSRQEIHDAFKLYDKDGNGTLDPKEFEEFARSLMRQGPDVFFARMGRNAVLHTAVIPATGVAVQRGLAGAIPAVANTPLAILAPLVGALAGAVRAFIPL